MTYHVISVNHHDYIYGPFKGEHEVLHTRLPHELARLIAERMNSESRIHNSGRLYFWGADDKEIDWGGYIRF